jgi:hypothetical protein
MDFCWVIFSYFSKIRVELAWPSVTWLQMALVSQWYTVDGLQRYLCSRKFSTLGFFINQSTLGPWFRGESRFTYDFEFVRNSIYSFEMEADSAVSIRPRKQIRRSKWRHGSLCENYYLFSIPLKGYSNKNKFICKDYMLIVTRKHTY